MSTSKLFEPYKLGANTLTNRTVMAPLTRNRALPGNVPNPLAVEYYSQRASAGLLVTEGTPVSQQGQGYQDVPGIYTKEQIAGWKKVTEAVHAKGGHIYMQIWHVGRISHVSLQPNGGAPVAPSAIRANTKTFVNNTFTDVSEPRALELGEIPASSTVSHAALPMRSKPASTASRSMAPTVICSSSSRVTAPTSAPTPMAARSRTAPN
jgi:N-ethylmaleimide reductase